MNNRRKLLKAFSAGALVGPRIAFAQEAGRNYRIGVLSAAEAIIFKEPHYVEFVRRLSELGLVEGRNLSVERRHADNRLERLPALAVELANLKCDVFFGGGTEAVLTTFTKTTRDTPIVFVAVDFDPISGKHVASLARPGGRVTGVTAIQSTMPAKRLELLKEMLPGAARVAVFTNETTSEQLSVTQAMAKRLGLQLHVVDLKRAPFDYEAGFSNAVRARADALFVLGSGLWVSAREKIIKLSLRSRLPTVFHQYGWVEAGGLMSYGFSFPGMWRRGADMVASVLRGVKVGEIPMEQPTSYELALNLRTAKAIGVKVPNSILVRADRVIE